jgi:dethiobiotin synthetase
VIVAVTGTGTGVGKTHVACALIGGLRDRGIDAVGWKPVESGVSPDAVDTDESLLRAASESAVAPTVRLRAPLSPHLAARLEGREIDGDAIRTRLGALAKKYDLVVLELAGGLCSPFDDRIDNLDWLAQVRPRMILVAPDRLGVLHDVSATLRAAAAIDLDVHAIVLGAPAIPDDSTTTNAAELRTRHGIQLVELPRAPIAELRGLSSLVALVSPALG